MNEQEIKEFLGLQYFPNLFIYNNLEGINSKNWIKVILPSPMPSLTRKGEYFNEFWIPNYQLDGDLEGKKYEITHDIINTIAVSSADLGLGTIDEISIHLFIDDINIFNRISVLCLNDRVIKRLDEKLFKLVAVSKPKIVSQ